MSIFKKDRKERIVIIGCSSFGIAIVNELSQKNTSIVVIDKDEKAYHKLSPSYKGFFIEGDGTDMDVLEMADLKNTDMVVAATNDDNTNIMIAQLAKRVFHVNKVVTRIIDANKQSSYPNMDIITICPVLLSVNELRKIAFNKETA